MHENGRLDGWKEIADFVGKSDNTVRRWEKTGGFPIHRVIGKNKSVYAYTSEINQWISSRTSDPDLPIPMKKFLIPFILFISVSFLVTPGDLIFLQYRRSNESHPEDKTGRLSVSILDEGNISAVRFFNAKGDLAYSIETDAMDYSKVLYGEYLGSCFYSVVDINQDGLDDIVLTDPAVDYGNMLRVLVQDQEGNVNCVREFPLDLVLDLDEKHHQGFITRNVLVRDLNGDNHPEIVITQNHHKYYPSFVRVFNENMRELLRIIHPGWLYNISITDRNADGVAELVISGTNNYLHEFSSPIFFVVEGGWKETGKVIDLTSGTHDFQVHCPSDISFTYIDLGHKDLATSYAHGDTAYLVKRYSKQSSNIFAVVGASSFILKETMVNGKVTRSYAQLRKFYFDNNLHLIDAYFNESFAKLLHVDTGSQENRQLLIPRRWTPSGWEALLPVSD